MKVWYFSCHGISHARNTDKLDEALTVVMAGFGPVNGSQCVHIIFCKCVRIYTPPCGCPVCVVMYSTCAAKNVEMCCGRPQSSRKRHDWATTAGTSNLICDTQSCSSCLCYSMCCGKNVCACWCVE